nr:ABC transporter permease [bacterium]
MRMAAFASRNRKELLRDPVSLIFGIGLPVFLLLLVTVIQRSIPEGGPEIFKMENFAPGTAVFSYAFIAMFSGMLLARDRSTSFLTRLFASPLTAWEYILGYSIPLLPMAMAQGVVCLGAACLLGLPVSLKLLMALVLLIPSALLFIGFGLLMGSLFSDKQIGVMASILVQMAALLSGMWFDLGLIGGAIEGICQVLPFTHALGLAQAGLTGNYTRLLPDLAWVLGYTAIVLGGAIWAFRGRMKGKN